VGFVSHTSRKVFMGLGVLMLYFCQSYLILNRLIIWLALEKYHKCLLECSSIPVFRKKGHLARFCHKTSIE
jgi:hypothetical protein